MVKEKSHPKAENLSQSSSIHEIILFNDEVNTFDYVIVSLMEVCDHDLEQAEQCATIAHFNGKCSIKKGTITELKPCCEELTRRKLSVKID